MSVNCRIVLVICLLVSMYLKAFVEGELRTKDGKKVYSFKFPFVVEFSHKLNFSRCIAATVSWQNSEAGQEKETPSVSLTLGFVNNVPSRVSQIGKFNYSVLLDENAINSSMLGYVGGRSNSDQKYKISVTLTCVHRAPENDKYEVSTLERSQLTITLRYCPQSRQPRLNYEMRKSFNDLSKVYCDNGANLYDGVKKLSSNERYSKCGGFGQWLDSFSCWFVPEVQLSLLQVTSYNKGENVLFSCNVAEGYPITSSAQLWIGNRKWPNKNNVTVVKMTESFNNKTVYCAASNSAGTNYSNAATLNVYFPLILESHALCLKPGLSNYSVWFSSNPPLKNSSLHFLLQVNNSTNLTIRGIWKEVEIRKYNTWLQKFTAVINLTENSALYFDYGCFGKTRSQKLDIVQNCQSKTTIRSSITTDDHFTLGGTTNTVDDDNTALHAIGAVVGVCVVLIVLVAVALAKRRRAQKHEVNDPVRADDDYCTMNAIKMANQGEAPNRLCMSANQKSSTTASMNSIYINVSMKSTCEAVGTSSAYEAVGGSSTYEAVRANSIYENVGAISNYEIITA